ncbi:hypothetical protein AGMMS49587_05090 [Spirochaetia bacterium]|nr:hypothetical protein AGMMS49587_05090 [Spirochaetia bacterium]
MDIQSLSVNMAQEKVQEAAAVQVEKMALDMAEIQSAELAKMMEAAAAITDPNAGNNINLLG